MAADHAQQEEITARVATVESELAKLAIESVDRASTFEEEGRLAESILDFRLALELEPDDAAILSHVQQLARTLEDRKDALRSTYEEDLAVGDLEAARVSLAQLRRLDPFDPEYETEVRQLESALRVERALREARARARQASRVQGLIEAGLEAFRNEQLENALGHWRGALLIDPANERLQAYIARAERQLESLRELQNSLPDDGRGAP